MSKQKLKTIVENAIAKADSSYFFEDYSKQAQAVLDALDKAGFAILAKDLPSEIWEKTANEMKTGRIRPEEHVKDVYQTLLRIMAAK